MEIYASPEDHGKRLDSFLADQLADVGRTRVQQWIRDGRVLIDGKTARASKRMLDGEKVDVDPAPPIPLKGLSRGHPP